jgi:hypothetical protein
VGRAAAAEVGGLHAVGVVVFDAREVRHRDDVAVVVVDVSGAVGEDALGIAGKACRGEAIAAALVLMVSGPAGADAAYGGVGELEDVADEVVGVVLLVEADGGGVVGVGNGVEGEVVDAALDVADAACMLQVRIPPIVITQIAPS